MFEDQNIQKQGEPQPIPLSNPEPTVMPQVNDIPVPNEPEDIFNDSKISSVPSTPPQPQAAPQTSGPLEPLRELPDDIDIEEKDKKFFILGIIVVLIIFGFIGYYVYNKFFKDSLDDLPSFNFDTTGDVIDNINDNTSDTTVPTKEDISDKVDEIIEKVAPESTKDSDQDGLTDERESSLGTDPFEVDSDGDGLFDREEVEVYHTNPLNPDTDGDGYVDGFQEVDKGYNPLGPGRLLDLNNIQE